MTDIVTLLRSRCNCNIDSSPCGAQECCREDREAAAEIERLRAVCTGQRALLREMADAIAEYKEYWMRSEHLAGTNAGRSARRVSSALNRIEKVLGKEPT